MKGFFKTVMIITVFSVCEKFLGFLYRIFLSRTIGAEGIGIYQVALSVFALLLTLIASGTPITVSRLMTKYKAEKKLDRVHKVVSAGIIITLLISLPVVLIIFLFNSSLSFIFADPRCTPVFLIVLPGLIFTSIYSVIRGVFWGNKDFLPYSIIELLEEICMIIVGAILILFSKSAFEGAIYSGIAVLVSYIFSFTLATIVFFIRKNRLVNPKGELVPLIKSTAPITAMRTANSLASSLVSIILPLRLVSAGYTNAQALSMFGSATGQALPLLFIPSTLLGSFTLVLIPEIAENYYKNQNLALKQNIEKAIKFTAVLSCTFIPIFIVCGEEIGIIIFNSHECGKYLTASSFLMLFMGLSNITTSILNSIGLENKTLIYFIIGSVFMLLSVWVLPNFIGIYSLLVGFIFVYGLTTLFNFILIGKNCKIKPNYLKYILLCTSLCIPTLIFGGCLEKMLISLLGNTFTFMVVGTLQAVFSIALYFGFNLIDLKFVMDRFKGLKIKKKVKRKGYQT